MSFEPRACSSPWHTRDLRLAEACWKVYWEAAAATITSWTLTVAGGWALDAMLTSRDGAGVAGAAAGMARAVRWDVLT